MKIQATSDAAGGSIDTRTAKAKPTDAVAKRSVWLRDQLSIGEDSAFSEYSTYAQSKTIAGIRDKLMRNVPEGTQLKVELTLANSEAKDLKLLDSEEDLRRLAGGPVARWDELKTFQKGDSIERGSRWSPGTVHPPQNPKYPKSIYDLSPEEVESETLAAVNACRYTLDYNFRSMTKAEIYKHVETIFSEYLGKDFLEPGKILFNPSSDPSRDIYLAGVAFCNTLGEHGARDDVNGTIEAEAHGYAGLSQDEIYATVRKNFPENMTLRDAQIMMEDLRKAGLQLDHGKTIKGKLHNTMYESGIPPKTMEKLFDTMLDLPVDFQKIMSECDGDSNYRNMHMDKDVVTRLLTCIGGEDLYDESIKDKIRSLL